MKSLIFFLFPMLLILVLSGVGFYLLFLIIKALKIYIKNNS